MLGVFGNSMVLQHDEPLIHGCGAAPHAPIAALVTPGLAGSSNEVVRRVADEIGCFQLPLAARPIMTAASESVSVAVKVSTGNASSPFFARAIRVLYGLQILCGGQSNTGLSFATGGLTNQRYDKWRLISVNANR